MLVRRLINQVIRSNHCKSEFAIVREVFRETNTVQVEYYVFLLDIF